MPDSKNSIQIFDVDDRLHKRQCELSHLYFTRYFFKQRQGIKFKVNWHHQFISDTIDEIIEGKKKNVVITVSPGSSKTELVVINFIARGLAINPRARFLHLSGSDSLASLNSSTAREIVMSDEFQKFWPMRIAEDAKAKKRWNVLMPDGQIGGGVYATALGGQVTGFRAGHMAPGFQGCFVAGTRVETDQGTKLINDLQIGDMVVSYDHSLGCLELKPVQAIREIIRGDIAETLFESGSKIRSTTCHRFYDGKSYRPISEFKSGESAYSISRIALAEMRKLSPNISKATVRSESSDESRYPFYFLFVQMLLRTCAKIRKVFAFARRILSGLQKEISSPFAFNENMFSEMCEQTSFTTDDGGRQFQFSSWGCISKSFQKTRKINYQERWQTVLDMWFRRTTSLPSFGSQQAQQYSGEFGNSLQTLSHDAPQIERNPISSYERLSDAPTKVYDIQVEGNHNFFAEGILVSNCILIDDPIKPEDAFSRSKLDAANRKLLTTVKSRKANPDTPMILIMQRIAEADCVGFIQGGNVDGDWHVVKIPAVIDEPYLSELPEKYKVLVDSSYQRDNRFSYWPYKEPLEQLLQMERGEGSDKAGAKISRHVFSSQYQQAPVALGGNIIRGEYFKRYTVLPKIKWRKIFADTAQKTKERNDYSVFEEWGLGDDGKIYLLALLRGRWEAPELQRRAIAFWTQARGRDSGLYGLVRKLQVEDKSSGTGLIQTLRLPPFNIPVEPIERNRDKLTRVMDALPYIECGLCAIPENESFTNDFVQECEAFTADDSHDFDDQIDPLLDAVNDMLQSGNKIKIWEELGKGNNEKENSKEAENLSARQNQCARLIQSARRRF